MATHPDPVTLAADPESGAVQFATRRVDGGGGALRLTLGYRRSADFDPRDDAGQDHAVVRGGPGRAVGVVADGVSQSFFGDIAARCVAEGLADFLWRHASAPPAAEAVAAELARLRARARRQVEARAVPTDVPELARTGLERLRGSAGSQAVFAAFVLDGERHRAHVYTVGDAVAVLHGAPGASLAVPVEPAGRWATHGAPPLGLRADQYAGVSAVVVRSDGARGWGDVLPGADAEQAFREQAPRLAGYDDVAFVVAQVEGGAAPSVPLALQASTRVEHLPGAEAEPAAAPGLPLPRAAASSPVRDLGPPSRTGRRGSDGDATVPVPDRDRRPVPLPSVAPDLRRGAAAAALVLLALSAGAGAQAWLRADPDEAAVERETSAARPEKPASPRAPAVRRERNAPVVAQPHRDPAVAGDGHPDEVDDLNAGLMEAIAAAEAREQADAREQAREEARAEVEARQEVAPMGQEGRTGRLRLPPALQLDPAGPRSESGHVESSRVERRPGDARPGATRTNPPGTRTAPERTRAQPERTQPRTQPERNQPRTPAERNQPRTQSAAARAAADPSAPAATPVAPVPVAPVRAGPGAPEGPAAPRPRQTETARPDSARTGSPHER